MPVRNMVNSNNAYKCIYCTRLQCFQTRPRSWEGRWSLDFKNDNSVECMGITVTLSPQRLFNIVGMYSPTSSKDVFFVLMIDILKQCDLSKELLQMGDFNLNWTDKVRSKKLKEITKKFELAQLFKGPTGITQSSQTQLDLILSNKPERITSSIIQLDHWPV